MKTKKIIWLFSMIAIISTSCEESMEGFFPSSTMSVIYDDNVDKTYLEVKFDDESQITGGVKFRSITNMDYFSLEWDENRKSYFLDYDGYFGSAEFKVGNQAEKVIVLMVTTIEIFQVDKIKKSEDFSLKWTGTYNWQGQVTAGCISSTFSNEVICNQVTEKDAWPIVFSKNQLQGLPAGQYSLKLRRFMESKDINHNQATLYSEYIAEDTIVDVVE